MTEAIASNIFIYSWIFLLCAALIAQIIFSERTKRRAGTITNLFVITPFVVVLGLFYLERFFGTYQSGSGTRIAGTIIIIAGIIGYVLSHFYLRSNWSIFASIKEGHRLITNGPYRLVRHPMYSSMVLVIFGSGLLVANYLMLVFTPLMFFIYYIRAKAEEKLLKDEFPEYAIYSKKTKMIIPGIL